MMHLTQRLHRELLIKLRCRLMTRRAGVPAAQVIMRLEFNDI